MCGCLKSHHTSVIDNVYLSNSETADLKVMEDAISDHFPILINLAMKIEPKVKTKTIYRRDFLRLLVSDHENALEMKDWSQLYIVKDPNEAVSLLLKNVGEALDIVAPLKAMKMLLFESHKQCDKIVKPTEGQSAPRGPN